MHISAELDIHRLYRESKDTFLCILLHLDYGDILSVLRAMPTRVKDLDEHFWVRKGTLELGIPTRTREEFVEYTTYYPSVVEGSEKYLDIGLCGMRAGMFKDRQLMQYFLNKGSDPTFIYYGLISHKDKSDVEDLMELLEPHSRKSGYYYQFCLGMSYMDLGWNIVINTPLKHSERIGFVRGLRVGGNTVLHKQVKDVYDPITASYMPKGDEIEPNNRWDARSILYSLLGSREDNLQEIKRLSSLLLSLSIQDVICESMQIGFLLAKSRRIEKKQWLIEHIKNDSHFVEYIQDARIRLLEIGWLFGLFAQGYGQQEDIRGYCDEVVEELWYLGYKKPNREYYKHLSFISEPSEYYHKAKQLKKDMMRRLEELCLVDLLTYIRE